MKRFLSHKPENLFQWSEATWNSYWDKPALVVVSDDNAEFKGDVFPKLAPTDASAVHRIQKVFTSSIDNTKWLSRRAWLKPSEYTKARFHIFGYPHAVGGHVDVDLETLDVLSYYTSNGAQQHYSITDADSGWVEVFQQVMIDVSTNTGAYVRITFIDSNGETVFAGNSGSGLYIARQQLFIGADDCPYTKTESSELWGPHETIKLTPERNYKRVDKPVDFSVKLATGNIDRIRYDTFAAFKIPVKYISSAHMAIINSWWYSGAELTYHEDADVYSVMVLNDRTPIPDAVTPYVDQFEGTIELEVY